MFNLLRKFFDTSAPDAGSASAAPSIASLMATKGVLNSSDTPVATPIDTTENKDTPAPASTAPPAMGTAQSAETGKSESPSPTEGKKEEPQKEEPKLPNWQEVLKSQQPDTVLKELGFDEKTIKFLTGKKGIDEKMLNFFSHWEENNGDVTKYLQELTTDYAKMPATEVMRHQLRKEYPKATDKQIDALYKKQVLDAYKLDPNLNSEDEVAEGQLLIEAVADKHREQFVNDQQQFLLPKPQKEEGPDLEQQAIKSLYDSYSKTLSEYTPVKELLSAKSLVIGEGDEKYNFSIPFAGEVVEGIMESLATSIYLGKLNRDNINQVITPEVVQNEILVRAFSKNPQAFISTLAEHYKAIGGKKIIEPLENASKPGQAQAAKSEGQPGTPAAAMAKGGRLVSGD